MQLQEGPMKKVSPIRRLDPLRHADLPFQERHSLILPKKGHVTELVICRHHQGRGITHASIGSLVETQQ